MTRYMFMFTGRQLAHIDSLTKPVGKSAACQRASLEACASSDLIFCKSSMCRCSTDLTRWTKTHEKFQRADKPLTDIERK